MLEENVATFFESGNGRVNWRYLPGFERSHLVFRTRQLGTALSLRSADRQAEEPDHHRRRATSRNCCASMKRTAHSTSWLSASEKGRDPYFRHFYRVGFDGKNLKLLTPEDANHDVTLSPSGQFFIDSYSKPDVPPVAVLRDATGKLLMTLEKADISQTARHRLEAATRRSPSKRATASTDLYGLMYKPTNLDPSEEISDHQSHLSRARRPAASAAARFPPRAATRRRSPNWASSSSKSTGWARRGARRNFTRRISATWATTRCRIRSPAMKQLARRYSVDRHRPRGHLRAFGRRLRDGAARCSAIPISSRWGSPKPGNHDNREYEDDWGEKWQGLLTRNRDGTTNYDNQANQNCRQESQRATAAGPRHDGRQRAAVQHAAGRRRTDQGQQGFRSAACCPIAASRFRQ